MFTVSDSPEDVVAALKGRRRWLSVEDIAPEDLLSSIKEGRQWPDAHQRKTQQRAGTGHWQSAQEDAPSLDMLTDHEVQILKSIAEGNSSKMMARKLIDTEGTVKVHVKVLKKLQFRSRVEAAVWAVSQGLH
ncbi:MAG: LuxR C-terminal-related transcriptional regulator [Gammaproteobacteria bacterium]